MPDRRRRLGIDVLEAARARIASAMDAATRVYVSFSGGKDSTVLLHLVMDEAITRGVRVGVLFVDLEAQYTLTIEHVARCYELYADHVEPYWVALPLNLRNAVSVYEPQWLCWDPNRRRDWVRTPPKLAITDEAELPFFHRGMEFEEFVPEFADWYAGDGDVACFVGIRTQESLNRWRTIQSSTKVRINNWPWSTRKSRHAWNAYPIYDWQTEDVWTYHAKFPDKPSNGVYDLMHRAGLTIHQARLCQPYGDDQRKGLWLFHVIEPETWGKVIARVNGANQGALYCQESGNILGQRKVTRPEGHTWQSFAELLLGSMPAATALHYRDKIDVFVRWWAQRGYDAGIPDEADPAWEASRRAPSWRRVCKALLRNDYWCKGLSFSQHKDQDSYTRYRAMMAKRRSSWDGGGECGAGVAWEHACGPDRPGRPTAKQLAMLCALTGGYTPQHAWDALGRHLGIDDAERVATRRDASRAIDAMKAVDGAFHGEKYSHRPRAVRGARVRTLPGERP